MAKKYVPSGYQIIDLGSHDLSSAVTLSSFEGDTKVLHDLCVELLENYPNKVAKPFLIKIIETNTEQMIIGNPILDVDSGNDYVRLFLHFTNDKYIEIVCDYTEIILSYVVNE